MLKLVDVAPIKTFDLYNVEVYMNIESLLQSMFKKESSVKELKLNGCKIILNKNYDVAKLKKNINVKIYMQALGRGCVGCGKNKKNKKRERQMYEPATYFTDYFTAPFLE